MVWGVVQVYDTIGLLFPEGKNVHLTLSARYRRMFGGMILWSGTVLPRCDRDIRSRDRARWCACYISFWISESVDEVTSLSEF